MKTRWKAHGTCSVGDPRWRTTHYDPSQVEPPRQTDKVANVTHPTPSRPKVFYLSLPHLLLTLLTATTIAADAIKVVDLTDVSHVIADLALPTIPPEPITGVPILPR